MRFTPKATTMTKTLNKAALSQTTEEYASRSSIHGIGYIFDKGLSIADRLLWLFVVLAFLGDAECLDIELLIAVEKRIGDKICIRL